MNGRHSLKWKQNHLSDSPATPLNKKHFDLSPVEYEILQKTSEYASIFCVSCGSEILFIDDAPYCKTGGLITWRHIESERFNRWLMYVLGVKLLKNLLLQKVPMFYEEIWLVMEFWMLRGRCYSIYVRVVDLTLLLLCDVCRSVSAVLYIQLK